MAIDLTQEEAASLEAAQMAGYMSSVGELEEAVAEPDMTDPAWSEFVLKHFEENELDPTGKPLVHGLRRVTHLLLGPILKSFAHTVQAPAFIPGNERLTMLQPAVVEYHIEVLNGRVGPGEEAYLVQVSDVADVYYGNTDAMFARFPTATAATRAEARCLRKLLRLKTPAAEEMTTVPVEEASVDGFITPTQLSFLNNLCRRCNINGAKYINLGKKKYERAHDISFNAAIKMAEHLSGLQNEPGNIDEKLKGYDHTWLS